MKILGYKTSVLLIGAGFSQVLERVETLRVLKFLA